MADMLQTTGKVWIKKKSTFRQTLKTLHVKYRKVCIFKNHSTWCRWRKKPEFPWHFSIFQYLASFFYGWREDWTWVSWLLQHWGGQASPVFCRFGFGAASQQGMSWVLLSVWSVVCTWHRTCSSIWGRIPVGSLGWPPFCWVNIDPHKKSPGQDLREDEIEQEGLLFVTEP